MGKKLTRYLGCLLPEPPDRTYRWIADYPGIGYLALKQLPPNNHRGWVASTNDIGSNWKIVVRRSVDHTFPLSYETTAPDLPTAIATLHTLICLGEPQ
jgi:hypothetical protein